MDVEVPTRANIGLDGTVIGWTAAITYGIARTAAQPHNPTLPIDPLNGLNNTGPPQLERLPQQKGRKAFAQALAEPEQRRAARAA